MPNGLRTTVPLETGSSLPPLKEGDGIFTVAPKSIGEAYRTLSNIQIDDYVRDDEECDSRERVCNKGDALAVYQAYTCPQLQSVQEGDL